MAPASAGNLDSSSKQTTAVGALKTHMLSLLTLTLSPLSSFVTHRESSGEKKSTVASIPL